MISRLHAGSESPHLHSHALEVAGSGEADVVERGRRCAGAVLQAAVQPQSKVAAAKPEAVVAAQHKVVVVARPLVHLRHRVQAHDKALEEARWACHTPSASRARAVVAAQDSGRTSPVPTNRFCGLSGTEEKAPNRWPAESTATSNNSLLPRHRLCQGAHAQARARGSGRRVVTALGRAAGGAHL